MVTWLQRVKVLFTFLPFLSCDDNRYASQDSEDAYRQLQRETLAEDEYADDYRRYRLQGSHDGGWRAADEIDGDGHEEKRQYRWQVSQWAFVKIMDVFWYL